MKILIYLLILLAVVLVVIFIRKLYWQREVKKAIKERENIENRFESRNKEEH